MTKEELKPIDVSKYKVTETGQVLKMTKEELEKENAELKEDLRNKKLAIQNRNGRIKELEAENAELKAQIEKMKCCGNCRYFDRDEPKYCDKCVFNAYICDKWRFAND